MDANIMSEDIIQQDNELKFVSDEMEQIRMEGVRQAWSKITTRKDENSRVWSYDANGRLICGAHNKSGLPCMKSPIDGRNRCQLHGGKTPIGLASPHARTLRYSRDVLGKALGERYEQAVNDDKLLELRDEIAILQARTAELLQHVESGDTQKTWRELKKSYGAFIKANRAGDAKTAADAMNMMGKLITSGYSQHQGWREVIDTISANRRLVESERKRLVDMQQTMTAEQAFGMLTYILSIIRKRTSELIGGDKGNELLGAISADISQYISTSKNSKNKKMNVYGDDE